MELGLQIKQAARLSGLKPITIISWEQSYRKPKKEYLEKLLGFYESKGAESKAIANLMKNILNDVL